MEDNCQKIKLVKLVEILRKDTDARHPITTNAFCRRLIDMHITCDRRTLARDMALLNEYGYEVHSCMRGHEKAYYMEESRFTVPEIKLLIDAVQAAGFVTERKTEELIEKLADLGGDLRSDIIRRNLVSFNTRKHTNEAVFDNIEVLEDALQEKRKVSFRYYDLDEWGRKIFRKDGRRYNTIPAALVYSEDNYYLVCYNRTYKSTTNYRVDRMDDVQLLDAEVDEDTLQELRELDFSEYTKEVFRMYAGPAANVHLRFDESVLGSVYDKFGEKLRVTRTGEHTLETKVRVQVSPTFFGWVFQFGGKMEIIAPNRVLSQFRALAGSLVCGGMTDENSDEDEENEETPF